MIYPSTKSTPCVNAGVNHEPRWIHDWLARHHGRHSGLPYVVFHKAVRAPFYKRFNKITDNLRLDEKVN